MGNCLVKKLKEVVNNDNLPIMGCVIVNIDAVANPDYANRYIAVNGSADFTIKVLGGNIVDGAGQALYNEVIYHSIDGKRSYRISNDTCRIVIPKYALNLLKLPYEAYIDIASLSYSSINNLDARLNAKTTGNIEMFNGKTMTLLAEGTSLYGDVSNIIFNSISLTDNRAVVGNLAVSDNINAIIVRRTNVVANLSDWAAKTTLTTLSLDGADKITGDISNLGALKNLSNVSMRNIPITGSIESLAEGLLAAGKTSKLQINFGGTVITMNNQNYFKENYNNHFIIFGSNSISIKSGSASGTEVASYNGSTWSYNM
jgi:hypothetical protein